jgi:hypothetical protein
MLDKPWEKGKNVDKEDEGFTLYVSKRERKATRRLSLSGKKNKNRKSNKGSSCTDKEVKNERPYMELQGHQKKGVPFS